MINNVISARENIYAVDIQYKQIEKLSITNQQSKIWKITYTKNDCLGCKISRVFLLFLITLGSLGLVLCSSRFKMSWRHTISAFKHRTVYVRQDAQIPTANPDNHPLNKLKSPKIPKITFRYSALGSFKDMPNDIIKSILDYLDPSETVYLSATNSKIKQVLNKKLAVLKDFVENSVTFLLRAFELIPTYEFGPGNDPIGSYNKGKLFSEKEQIERFDELKKTVMKVCKRDINKRYGYQDGMMYHTVSLLLHATDHMHHQERRLEFVQLLLKRGIDLTTAGGFCYVPLDIIVSAKETTKDVKLIALLEAELKKQKALKKSNCS